MKVSLVVYCSYTLHKDPKPPKSIENEIATIITPPPVDSSSVSRQYYLCVNCFIRLCKILAFWNTDWRFVYILCKLIPTFWGLIYFKKDSFPPTLQNYFWDPDAARSRHLVSAVTQIHLQVYGNKLHCQLRILGLSQGDQRVFGFQI